MIETETAKQLPINYLFTTKQTTLKSTRERNHDIFVRDLNS